MLIGKEDSHRKYIFCKSHSSQRIPGIKHNGGRDGAAVPNAKLRKIMGERGGGGEGFPWVLQRQERGLTGVGLLDSMTGGMDRL